MISSRAARLTPWALAAAAYAALTIIFTWPLVLHTSSALPHDLGDPILGTFILWWNAHVTPLSEQWWNAPYFWPTSGVTTFSEHLLGISLLTSPLQWLGTSPVTAYNVAFLVTFPLSALGAHALAFRLTRRHDAAAIAGLIYGFNPYRTAQLSHLQVIWSFWMPFALMALHAFRDDRRVRWLALFGVLALAQGLGNLYYLVFFPVLIAIWAIWFFDARREPGRIVQIAIAFALAMTPIVPILLRYRRVHAEFGFERGVGEMRVFSADLLSLVHAVPEVALWGPLASRSAAGVEQQMFFGLTALLVVAAVVVLSAVHARAERGPWPRARTGVAVLGCVFGTLAIITAIVGPWHIAVFGRTLATLGRTDKPLSIAIMLGVMVAATGPRAMAVLRVRSAFAFYVLAALVLFALSLGPEPAVGGVPFFYKGPWAWLMRLPGFNGIRVPARFAMLVVLCLSAAAALGFVTLIARVPARFHRWAAALAIAGVLADSWISGLAIVPIPDRWAIEERLTGGGPVLELPLGDPLPDLASMYRSMYHGHPTINGWGGYFPVYYDLLYLALEKPRADAIAALTALGDTTTVVVDERATDGVAWARILTLSRDAIETAHEGRVRVFTLPAVRMSDTFDTPRLGIQAVSGNAGPIDLALVTDGNSATGWISEHEQRGDEVITIDLGGTRRLDGLTMALGHFAGGFPRELAIETSVDGLEWKPRPAPNALALAIRAARLRPRDVPMLYRLEGAPARYIRMRQTGQDPHARWSFADLAVYGN